MRSFIYLLKTLVSTFYGLLFRRNSFSCVLSLGRDLDFLIYERPGVWCSDKELNQIYDYLWQVAESSQGKKGIPEYGALERSREDMKTRILCIAYDKKLKRPVAFSSQVYLATAEGRFYEEVLHLGLVFIDANYQGKSISYLISVLPNALLLIKSGFRPIWISNVSQVPAVIGLVSQNYVNVWPHYEKAQKQTFMHRKLSSLIMQSHRKKFGVGEEAGFDLDKQIITNAYTGGSDLLKKTYTEAQKHRFDSVNLMCQENLDYQRGDDFLQIGILDGTVVSSVFKKRMGKKYFLAITLNMIVFGLATLLVPLMRWLIPSTKYNPYLGREQKI
jgi:hypothetical protein